MKDVEERMREMFQRAPATRSNVVTTRIGDEQMHTIDMLIEAGLFGTLSEAAAFLLNEGIKARTKDLQKISSELEKIRGIRKEAEQHIAKLKREIGIADQVTETGEQHNRRCPKCSKDLANLPRDIVVCPYCGSDL